MSIWEYSYCPSEIINESPAEYIFRLNKDSPQETTIIVRRLDTICELEKHLWPPKWVKPIDKKAKNLYQLTAGNHRVYFGIYGRKLLIFYICRKKSMEAKPIDINRAKLNQKTYENWESGEQ
jgi:hypothetical protein